MKSFCVFPFGVNIVSTIVLACLLLFQSSAARSDDHNKILITIKHNSENEAEIFNSLNRHHAGRRNYQSVMAAQRQLAELVSDYRLIDLKQGWQISSIDVYCGAFQLDDGADVQAVLNALKADARVESAQPMLGYNALAAKYDDTYFARQYGEYSAVLETLHQQTTGRGVSIAVIDTGLDTQHQEFKGLAIKTRNFVDSDKRRFNRDTHGTAIAGVISARANNTLGIVGLAPDARLTAIKACWHPREAQKAPAKCNSLTVAAALDHAIANDTDIINMSLAGPKDPLVSRLIKTAAEKHILMIAADPLTGPWRYPAQLPEVLAVNNASQNNNDRGSGLYLSGTDILSTAPGSHFDFYSGASISAARASGIAALSMQRNPQAAVEQRIDLISDIATALGFRYNKH